MTLNCSHPELKSYYISSSDLQLLNMLVLLNRPTAQLCHRLTPENHVTNITPGQARDNIYLEHAFTNRTVSMTTEDLNRNSGYIPPINQWHRYTEIVDYPDTIQSASISSPAVSMPSGDESGYIHPGDESGYIHPGRESQNYYNAQD